MRIDERDSLVAECIAGAAEAHLLQSFLKEEELQWFLAHEIRQRVGATVERERRTKDPYVTDGDGFLLLAKNRIEGRRRSYGRIDIAIPEAGRTMNLNVAIEVKLPRGANQDIYLGGNLQRDARKLLDLGDTARKYIIAFIDVHHMDTLQTGMKKLRDTGLLQDISWCAVIFDERTIASVIGHPCDFVESVKSRLKFAS
jgi:hypothetical protein